MEKAKERVKDAKGPGRQGLYPTRPVSHYIVQLLKYNGLLKTGNHIQRGVRQGRETRGYHPLTITEADLSVLFSGGYLRVTLKT